MRRSIQRRQAPTSALATLMAEAAILGNSYVRAGNQWDPDAGAFVGANTPVTRNVVIGGVTVPMVLMERAGTNLATQLATASYALATTVRSTIWWDGAAGDYTLTTNGGGTFSAKRVTADGRNYQTITGHSAGNTVTCTRAGGATNTKLQVEQVDNPTSWMGLSGTRSDSAWKHTGLTTGDNNTLVMLFQPYGWTQNIGPTDAGIHFFRETAGGSDSLYLAQADATRLTFTRKYNGGVRAITVPFLPIDGHNRLTTISWSLADATDWAASGRSNKEFSDGYAGEKGVVQTAVTPITTFTSLDLGCYIAAPGRQPNGWIAILKLDLVLTQDEKDQLAIAVEGASGYTPEITNWGDSNSIFQENISWPEVLVKTYRIGNRLWNGAISGYTTANMLTDFLADPRKWRGFQFFWCNNAFALSDIQAMVNQLGHLRYLVFPRYNRSDEPAGSAAYIAKMADNAALAVAFGANYYDMRAYQITLNTVGDAADTAADIVGTSQRGDEIHMNATGWGHIAAKADALMTAMGVTYP